MRLTFWMLLAAAPLALGACGSQEQPPAKPVPPASTIAAPAPPPATPAAEPAPPAPTAPTTTAAPASDETRPGKISAADQPAAPPPSTAAAKSTTRTDHIPELLILPASQGEVSLPHLAHAKGFPCASCHGDGTPGKISLTRESAHELCRDCHKAKGAGPTSCTGCHRK